MLAKYLLIIRNYVLSVSSQRKYNFYHQNTLLDAFRTNSRNIIGRNPSMVIPLSANQDLTLMLFSCYSCQACSLQTSFLKAQHQYTHVRIRRAPDEDTNVRRSVIITRTGTQRNGRTSLFSLKMHPGAPFTKRRAST